MGLPAHQARLPSWDSPASHPDREIPSRLGTTQIKMAQQPWITAGLPLYTLHHAIYCLSLSLAASEPPIRHLNEGRDRMPLLRESRKQALPYRSLA